MPDITKKEMSSTAFHSPIVPAGVKTNEVSATSFADLVRMMAEGIANAQQSLDKSSADMLADLANTHVNALVSS